MSAPLPSALRARFQRYIVKGGVKLGHLRLCCLVDFRLAPWNRRLLTKQAGSGAHCPVRGNSLSGFLRGFLALPETIAFAVHLEDRDVVREPVEQRAREAF